MSSFWSNSHMTPMFETFFLRLVHLCEVFENCSIRLSNDWNHFYETTDHLQQLRADKFSTFFKSEAFTFSSGRLVKLNSFNFGWKRCNTSKGYRGLSAYCKCSKMITIPFFWFSLKLRPFHSPLCFRLSIMCRRDFNKTIILLDLLKMKW